MNALTLAFLVAGTMMVGGLVGHATLGLGRGTWSGGGDVVLRILPGLFLALLTVVLARALQRDVPTRVRSRLVIAFLAGGVAAVLIHGGGGDFDSLQRLGGAPADAAWLLLVPTQPLLAWPWGSPRRASAPSADWTPGVRSRLAWLLPFLLAAGLSCGAFVGFAVAAGNDLERDPVGSLLALMTLLTVVGAFVVSIVTVIVAKALRRPPPGRLAPRVLASGVIGVALGALTWSGSDGSGAGLDVLLLLVAPAVLSWSWRPRAAAVAKAPAPPLATLALALLALAPAVAATPPPLRVTLELGVDSRGIPWSVDAGVDGPLVLFGDRSIEVAPARRLEHMSLSTALDAHDRAWIVDATGHGVRVELASGRFEPQALPVSRQLVGGLAPDGTFVYLGDADGSGRSALARVDLATNRLVRLHEIVAPQSLLAFCVGPRNAWVVSWNGLAGPRHVLHVTAVDKAAGKVRQQATLSVDWAPVRWQGLSLDEDAGGNLWIADAYSGQLHRLDSAGTWRSWSFGPRTPTAVVAVGSGAVVQLVRQQALEDALRPTGAPTHEISGVELALISNSEAPPVTLTLERGHWGPTLRGDRFGRVWFGRGTQVRVSGGRPELVPAR